MTEFLTADHHFGHAKIIEYCDRPFASLDDMHAHLIRAWNDVVAPGDLVYHLGDMFLGYYRAFLEIRAQLHGDIILIRGNHDRIKGPVRGAFRAVFPSIEYTFPHHILLTHRPTARAGLVNAHGHTHGRTPDTPWSIDVGVDAVAGFAPITFEQFWKRVEQAQFLRSVAESKERIEKWPEWKKRAAAEGSPRERLKRSLEENEQELEKYPQEIRANVSAWSIFPPIIPKDEAEIGALVAERLAAKKTRKVSK